MQFKRALCAGLAITILALAGCSTPEHEPVNTIAPAELTSEEKSLLGLLTETYFAFDMKLGMEVEHIGYEMWIEHYEKGTKVAEHTLMNIYSSGSLEPETIQDRVIIARMYRTEAEEIWLARIGGASSNPALPISPDFQAWGPTHGQEFDIGQPVILSYMVAGEYPIITHSSVNANGEAFKDLVSNDAVYVIFLKVYHKDRVEDSFLLGGR